MRRFSVICLTVPVLESTLEAPPLSAQEQRVVDAGLRCFARWGVAKTTLDDIGREAGYSRATVYRLVPGGKDGLLDAILRAELGRFLGALAAHVEAATDLEDLLVRAVTFTAAEIRDHKPLQYLLAHEPEVVLPRISFNHLGELLEQVGLVGAPYVARHLPSDSDVDARRTAEWVGRIVLSYTLCPADHVDMGSESSVRSLIRRFVLPGLVMPS